MLSASCNVFVFFLGCWHKNAIVSLCVFVRVLDTAPSLFEKQQKIEQTPTLRPVVIARRPARWSRRFASGRVLSLSVAAFCVAAHVTTCFNIVFLLVANCGPRPCASSQSGNSCRPLCTCPLRFVLKFRGSAVVIGLLSKALSASVPICYSCRVVFLPASLFFISIFFFFPLSCVLFGGLIFPSSACITSVARSSFIVVVERACFDRLYSKLPCLKRYWKISRISIVAI